MRFVHIAMLMCIPGCYLSHTFPDSMEDARVELDAGPQPDVGEACVAGDPMGEFSFGPDCFGEDQGYGDYCCTTGSFASMIGPGCDLEEAFVGLRYPDGSLILYYVFEGRLYAIPRRTRMISWVGEPDADGIPTEISDGRHVCAVFIQVPDEVLLGIPAASSQVPFRPGVFILKLPEDDQLYVVARGFLYRRISRELAERIYGDTYERRIRVVPEGFFFVGGYEIGPDVTTIEEFDPVWESRTTLPAELRSRP